MKFAEIQRKLEKELSSRGLKLVWRPGSSKLGKDDLVVFGANQKTRQHEPLIDGFAGPASFSDPPSIQEYQESFLNSLEAVGIPRSSLESQYPIVGRGRISPTFVARLKQKNFRKLKAFKK